MIVKLKPNKKANDLILNKNYSVISIEFLSSKNKITSMYFRILCEKGIPAMYDKNLFIIIDDSIGADYVFKENNIESFDLVPRIMSYKGFWDDFFNLDNDAINIFKKRFPEYKDKLFY